MIEIVNLGLNNLGSIMSAFASSTKAPIKVVESVSDTDAPRLLVLPGTGSFGVAMGVLEERGLRDAMKDYREQPSVFIVGICLGMQLFAEKSEESPGVRGIGLVSGDVRRLAIFDGLDGRVPHVGWAGLEGLGSAESFIFDDKTQRDVYFSHSYHLVLNDSQADVLTVSRGDTRFIGAFRKNNLSGYQFHPEKSSSFGLHVLSEMLRWAGIED